VTDSGPVFWWNGKFLVNVFEISWNNRCEIDYFPHFSISRGAEVEN
jgi:hypothetical protein